MFYVNANETNVTKCLLYYIDRPPREAWMLHDNEYYASGFDASYAAEFRASQGVWKIYTGDYSGNLWKLEEANANDNSNMFYGGFTTPPIHMGNERAEKKVKTRDYSNAGAGSI